MKNIQKKLNSMTRDQKIKEAKRTMEQVRKRVERLQPIKDLYGDIPALETVKERRREYSMFDVESGKLRVKRNGKTINPVQLTDSELNAVIEQGDKWLSLKTSTVKGAKDAVAKRTKASLQALSEILPGENQELSDWLDDTKTKKSLLDKAEVMSDFWNTISELRNKSPKLKDKIRNPNEYKDIFQMVLDAFGDKRLIGLTPVGIASILSKSINERAHKEEIEARTRSHESVRQSGGALPDTLKGPRMTGNYKGNKRMK